MNRGTALKWIDRIENGGYEFGRGALRLTENCFCPLGVLAHFLDPDGWKINELGMYEWHGEICKLTDDARKRCKMKSIWGSFKTNNGFEGNLVDVSDGCTDWRTPLYIIKQYHEQL